MAVTNQTPVITYTASGSSNVFAYPFRILLSSDLGVYFNSILVNTGYTVSGVGDISGGSVTFTTPPDAGIKVKLLRSIPRTRTTDYIEGGALPAAALDADFDRAVLMLQDIRADSASLVEFDAIATQIAGSTAIAVAAANTAVSESGAASSSAASALSSKNTATTKAAEAVTSASGASSSASAASTSASSASTSATAASGSAAAASTSATNAGTSATNASTSASGAGTSATNASNSATAAAGSATAASGSATAAAGSATAAAASAASLVLPVGWIAHMAMNTAPSGWLKANGAAVSRTTYSALFTAIGMTYGVGNGTTTFNVPDLRGEFVRGWDDGRGVDTSRAIGTAQADDFKAHTHSASLGYSTGIGDGGSYGAGFSAGNTGSTGGTETRPRNIALLACIKY